MTERARDGFTVSYFILGFESMHLSMFLVTLHTHLIINVPQFIFDLVCLFIYTMNCNLSFLNELE